MARGLQSQGNRLFGSIGTTQLPGEWCDSGKTYTLGKDNAVNLTLKSAEYTIGRVKVGSRVFSVFRHLAQSPPPCFGISWLHWHWGLDGGLAARRRLG